MPGYSPDTGTNYRAKAEEEILKIQEKAKELEFLMRQFKIERDAQGPMGARITDESAHAIIAANPKLAWILGGDLMDPTNSPRPRTVFSPTHEGSDRPSTAGSTNDPPLGRLPRKSKSNGALDEAARQTLAVQKPENSITSPPVKRLKFYCTFCQKRFHSQAEWSRHERTIHIPEELWVCCPRTGAFPTRCPFCEKSHPSPAHLADHNYLSCQEKPLSERTFGRKDHFLLHISQVHKVSPGQKPARLTELENAWRQPLPIELGHQALHCGFCGLKFPTYQERTAHVAQHFSEGADMMSWWKERVNHDEVLEVEAKPGYTDLPHVCAYCGRAFETLAKAKKFHPVCSMWSCSFLPGIQYTIYPTGTQQKPEAVCCYCNDPLGKGAEGKVNGTILKEHMIQHNFRTCNQGLYFSGQMFRQHLQDNHKILYDSTLFAGWTLLLKSSRREKPSIFRQVEVKPPIRRSNTDPIVPPKKKKKRSKSDRVQPTPTNFMELTEIPQRAEPNKLRRKQSGVTIPPEEEIRASTHFFSRAATADFAGMNLALQSPRPMHSASQSRSEKSAGPLMVKAPSNYPTFYRRRLDASTRNRLYLGEDEEIMTLNSQQLFRKIPGSVLGGLVLHSSLAAAVPARLTNSVDIYSMQ
ncbi:hypothetical protein GQ44DRAFT_696471 [Phaeosphaeriaceae sp. PMI808]|nr:hypothetical protein GQ44DRAFT_696471 [Phaeosphaeriaceae sp. PMI808]